MHTYGKVDRHGEINPRQDLFPFRYNVYGYVGPVTGGCAGALVNWLPHGVKPVSAGEVLGPRTDTIPATIGKLHNGGTGIEQCGLGQECQEVYNGVHGVSAGTFGSKPLAGQRHVAAIGDFGTDTGTQDVFGKADAVQLDVGFVIIVKICREWWVGSCQKFRREGLWHFVREVTIVETDGGVQRFRAIGSLKPPITRIFRFVVTGVQGRHSRPVWSWCARRISSIRPPREVEKFAFVHHAVNHA